MLFTHFSPHRHKDTEILNVNEAKRNRISGIVLDASIEVHRNLGPGLLESVYESCLYSELTDRKIACKRQVVLPIQYKGKRLDEKLVIDILVENEIIIELKAVERILPIHEAQVLTYLRLSNKRLGLLINFNMPTLKEGFKRLINGFD